MDKRVAIFTPILGFPLYTYIDRHINDLLPDDTVVIAAKLFTSGKDILHTKSPVLILDNIKIKGVDNSYLKGLHHNAGQEVTNAVIRSFLKKHGVQVMMGEFLDKSLPLLEIAKTLNIRFFAHAHGIDVSAAFQRSELRGRYRKYVEADGIVTINQVSRERLIGIGIDPAKVHIIPCGVEVPARPHKTHQGDVIRCVAVGRMVPKKGPILALDAFRRAVEKFPELRLDYIGAGSLLPAARQFVQAFGMGQSVIFHGEQPNDFVKRVLSEADIFIQHSITNPDNGDEEGLPVAILEAMAHGLPVVSTRHAGIPEAVLEGVTGYLVEEGDSFSMSCRILDLAYDINKRKEMGIAGWVRVKNYFSWERERRALLQVLLPEQN